MSMTRVSLRAYDREIEGLIEQGNRLDEAVAHCRHILKSYPKHLETYRLLGKAYLEAKHYDQAVDIFQRVLVADPEDFVSHVGMSIIADDRGKLDDAIWHMERAFEVQPSNAAIQGELQRLFGRRDGVEPPKIRLTRGALAHMYVQGELYTQAISEIRAVLGHDENRTDMQVLLARAYLRNGQKAEALDACSALLSVSPYCLDANRLMAEILAGGQSDEAAREHRRRVFELDPYAEFAKGSLYDVAGVPDGAVSLARLEYVEEPASVSSPIPTMGLETTYERQDRTSPPAWLTSTPEVAEGQTANPSNVAMPEFMRDAGWQEMPADTADFERPDEGAADIDSVAEPGDLPDWVKALAPSDEVEPQLPVEDAGANLAAWLPEGGTESAMPSAAPSKGIGEDIGTADWLRDLSEQPDTWSSAKPTPTPEQSAGPIEEKSTAAFGSTGPQHQDRDDGLAWLEGLAEKHGAKPEELLTPPEARPSVPPSWAEQNAILEPQVARRDLGEVAATEQPASSPEPSAGKSLDWLSGLSDEGTFKDAEAPSEAEQAPIMDAPPAEVWPQPERADRDAELPDWLAKAPTMSPNASAPAQREPSGEYESAVDLPDWLAGLDSEKAGRTPASTAPTPSPPPAEELPDWLKDDTETAPPAAPQAASEWQRAEPESISASAPDEPAAELQAQAATGNLGGRAPVSEEDELQLSPRPRPMAGPAALGPSLGSARAELGRGNIAAALDLYARLTRKGKSLEEIIRDLRDALYRYPVEVPIWQALGDAYMRANRLQEALDAYTKAEELLR